MVNDIKEEANTKETGYSNQAHTENTARMIKNIPENSSSDSENISQKEKLIIEKLKELFDAVEYKIN